MLWVSHPPSPLTFPKLYFAPLPPLPSLSERLVWMKHWACTYMYVQYVLDIHEQLLPVAEVGVQPAIDVP